LTEYFVYGNVEVTQNISNVTMKPDLKELNNLVAMDNVFVLNLAAMTLNEKRFIYIVLSKIKSSYLIKPKKSEEDHRANTPDPWLNRKRAEGEVVVGKTYTLSVREYAKLCDLRLDNARTELIDVVNRLYDRSINTREGNKFCKVRWCQKITHDPDTDIVSLVWTDDVVAFISNLVEKFVEFRLYDVLQLSSSYSWRLYEILKTTKGANQYVKVEFEIEKLYELMDVAESCKEFKYFKSRILDKSVQELKMKNIFPTLDYRLITGKGKKVVKIVFIGVHKVVKEFENEKVY